MWKVVSGALASFCSSCLVWCSARVEVVPEYAAARVPYVLEEFYAKTFKMVNKTYHRWTYLCHVLSIEIFSRTPKRYGRKHTR